MTQIPPTTPESNGNSPIDVQNPEGLTDLSDFDRRVLDEFSRTPSTPPASGEGNEGTQAPPEAGGGDAAVTPPEVTPSVPQGEPAVPPQPDPLTYVAPQYQIGDRTLEFEEAVRAMQVYDWVNGLEEPQLNAIDGLLSGNYLLVPQSEQEAIQAFYESRMREGQQQTLEPQTPSPIIPPVEEFDETQYTDPVLAKQMHDYMARMEAQLQSLQQGQQQVQLTQEQQQQIAARQQIEVGEQVFAQQYELEPDDMQALRYALANSNQFQGFLQGAGGNYQAAVQAGLEAMYWQHPGFRQRAIQQAAQQQADQLLLANQDQQQKTQKQAALTGGGGSVARTSQPADPAKMSQTERDAGLEKAIATAMAKGEWVVEQ